MKTPAKTPPPPFDEKTAKSVTPYRHASGRTVAFHQPAGDQAHLFSATFAFVATATAATAEAAAKKAETDDKAARAEAAKVNDDEHAKRMKAAAPTETSNS